MDMPTGFPDSELGRVGAEAERAATVVTVDNLLRSRLIQGKNAQGLHRLLNALPAAVYMTDADGRITYYNDAAAALWGCRPARGSADWCGSWKLYWPDGNPMTHDECPMAVALKEKRPVRGQEAIAERPDGTRVPFLAYPTPLFDGSGRLTGGINTLIDLTERKRAEEQQALLIRELHHRVKNTLATVQAIMGATARTAGSINDFKTALIGRIGSLAKTHLLLAEEMHPANLIDLLRRELDAFDDGSEDRIVVRGPPVDLSNELAVSLGMAMHELATNAAKFGALSVPGGKVAATWQVSIEAKRHILELDWVESGGPPVAPPQRQGFGARLLEIVLPSQINAETHIKYAPEGVHVHYSVPLPTHH